MSSKGRKLIQDETTDCTALCGDTCQCNVILHGFVGAGILMAVIVIVLVLLVFFFGSEQPVYDSILTKPFGSLEDWTPKFSGVISKKGEVMSIS